MFFVSNSSKTVGPNDSDYGIEVNSKEPAQTVSSIP